MRRPVQRWMRNVVTSTTKRVYDSDMSTKRGSIIVLGIMLAVSGCASAQEPAPSSSSPPVADLSQQGDTEFWAGKDNTGVLHMLVDDFNAQHPQGQITIHELPDNSDGQRQQILLNAQTRNPRMGVISTDAVWTAEFAANGIIIELPKDSFSTDGLLPAAVDSGTYFNKLYAYPIEAGAGLLYYRSDLLKKAGIDEPPTTWSELEQACRKVQALPGQKIDCYGAQLQKYEGLTVNAAEAIDGAGGRILDDQGRPAVNSPQAVAGLTRLATWVQNGTIPRGALTWQEEPSRQAFQSGKLIFLRNWAYVYTMANKDDGSSKVAGKFDVAPLPGENGPGVSSYGGANYAIAATAENKGTAADFIRFMGSRESQRTRLMTSSNAPTAAALYTDPEVVKKYPYMPVLLTAVEGARPRPKAVKYGDVTLAIQDSAYAAITGETAPADALSQLQTKLEELIR